MTYDAARRVVVLHGGGLEEASAEKTAELAARLEIGTTPAIARLVSRPLGVGS